MLRLFLVITLLCIGSSGFSQSLAGSQTTLRTIHTYFSTHNYPFLRTETAIVRLYNAGELRHIDDPFIKKTLGYNTYDIRWDYVRPAVFSFIQVLALDMRTACHEPLVLTSALRLVGNSPPNGSKRFTVHPTGFAIDIRKPKGTALIWLRQYLLNAEQTGVLDVTEEFYPPHFHVVVFPQYRVPITTLHDHELPPIRPAVQLVQR